LPFLLRGTDAIATIPAHAAQALCDLGPFAVSVCPLALPLYAYGISWRFDAIRNAPAMQVREMVTDAFKDVPSRWRGNPKACHVTGFGRKRCRRFREFGDTSFAGDQGAVCQVLRSLRDKVEV
jgi:hypothetical protein